MDESERPRSKDQRMKLILRFGFDIDLITEIETDVYNAV
jgi:hypothetical protein